MLPQTRLDANYRRQVGDVRARVLAYAERQWGGLGSYRDADYEMLVAQLVPRVEAGQQRIADLTDAYIRQVSELELKQAVRTGSAIAASTAALRGVDAATVYQRPFNTVYTKLSEGKSLTAAAAAGGARLTDIVGTGLQLSKTHAARDTMSRSKFTAHRRVLTGRENCALCVIASTQRYSTGNLMPIHPGCVVEGTSVRAADVSAVTRRWYEGEVIVLRSAGGHQVTITPNHPVLTDRGWVPAGVLRVGDRVVRGGLGHGVVGGGPDEKQAPALIEDVWRAASMSGFRTVPTAAEDFHGDGSESEVDIVWTDSDLPAVEGVSFVEPRREASFMAGEGGRVPLTSESVLALLFRGDLLAPQSFMRSSGLRLPLLRSHAGRPVQPGGLTVSDLDAFCDEHLPDSGAFNPELLGDFEFGHAGLVGGGDLRGGQLLPKRDSRRFDPASAQFLGEGRGAYADLGRSLLGRLAGATELDTLVVARRIESFRGHVFNLNTVEGWYSADSLIVSNCDCDTKPYVGPDEQVIDPDLLEQTHAAVEQEFGDTDRNARFLDGRNERSDYLDLIVANQHSEIGPIIGWRSQHFAGPEVLT